MSDDNAKPIKKYKRAALVKNGNQVADNLLWSHAQIIKVMLSQILPDDNWRIDFYEIETAPELQP